MDDDEKELRATTFAFTPRTLKLSAVDWIEELLQFMLVVSGINLIDI